MTTLKHLIIKFFFETLQRHHFCNLVKLKEQITAYDPFDD